MITIVKTKQSSKLKNYVVNISKTKRDRAAAKGCLSLAVVVSIAHRIIAGNDRNGHIVPPPSERYRNTRFGCRRVIAQRTVSLEILSTAAQLYEKNHI